MSAALFVILAAGALCASLALLMARLGLFLLADVLAVGAAALGVSAVAATARPTVQHARRLSS